MEIKVDEAMDDDEEEECVKHFETSEFEKFQTKLEELISEKQASNVQKNNLIIQGTSFTLYMYFWEKILLNLKL